MTTQILQGPYGPYASVILETDKGRIRVSNNCIEELFANANLIPGRIVRVIYTGVSDNGHGLVQKVYKLLLQVPMPSEPEEQPSVPGAE